MNKRIMEKVEFWSCLGLMMFFFLPWVSLGFGTTLSGYQWAESHSPAGKMLWYCIPLLGLLCVGEDLRSNGRVRTGYVVAGIFPLLMLGLAYMGESELLQRFSIGAWLTFSAAVGAIVGTLRPRRKESKKAEPANS